MRLATSFLLLVLAFAVSSFLQSRAAFEDWKTTRPAYMKRLGQKIQRHWIPQHAKEKYDLTVEWKIHRDGSISGLKLLTKDPTGIGKAALDAVRNSVPFEKLPPDADDTFSIEFSLSYEPSAPLSLSVPAAVQMYGPEARPRLQAMFESAGLSYPPRQITLIAFKDDYLLHLFAADKKGNQQKIQIYSIQGASGKQGPKLKEGDLQVPEGKYKIDGLLAWQHLALSVNYPNASDRARAQADKRTKLGGYIQIHGGYISTGCLAIEMDAIEDLFVLANDIGPKNISLIICPCNLLVKSPDLEFRKQPKWLPALYADLKNSISKYPLK